MNNIVANRTYRYLNILPYNILFNWSASSILGNHLKYKAGLQLIKIGKLIEKNQDRIDIQNDLSYRRVKIKLYGKGVSQRDEVKGHEIGTKRQFIISEGQFIMSKIDARNGAFGIVSKQLDGAIVTPDFLSYNINKKIVIPDFFLLLTNTTQFQELCQNSSSGTTGRQRIDESSFLNFQIPIPSFSEQKKLVSKYRQKEDLAKKQANDAAKIEKEIDQHLLSNLGLVINKNNYNNKQIHYTEFKSLTSWGVDKILNSLSFKSLKFPTATLESNPVLYKDIFRGKSPKYDKNGKGRILNQKCNRWNFIQLEYARAVNDNWLKGIEREFLTQENDIIINSTGEGTIGRASLITKQHEGLLYDSHLLLLRLDIKKINPAFLVMLINHEYGQSQIESLKSAKSTKQTELGVQNLLKVLFPLPPKRKQDSIVKFILNKKSGADQLLKKSQINQQIAIDEFEKQIFE